MSKLTWLGHSAFIIEGKNVRLIIDPYLKGFPGKSLNPKDIKVDYVLLTHGHGDHLGSGIEIANINDAMIIAPFELAVYCGNMGCKIHPMHIGGSFTFPFGRVKMTIAHHSSGADLGNKAMAYMGNPCGLLITLDNKTIYHAGDTGLFLDMQLIGEMNTIDTALLPIGDNFTMGVDDAVKAAEFLKPGLVIPMHYNTFDVIAADPDDFRIKAGLKKINVRVMTIGETISI